MCYQLIKMYNYWIYKDSIIFRPKYNKPLCNYIEIIKKYKKIIFSNYDDLEICIETNNIDINKYDINYVRSRFNHPLKNSLSDLINLTHLTFGNCFNLNTIKN